MWYRLLAFALSISIASCSLLTIVWGERGMQAEQELQKYRLRLEKNILELEDNGLKLQNTLERLEVEHRYLEIHAHNAGIVAKSDIRIRIDELHTTDSNISPGTVLRKPPSSFVDAAFLRFFSLFAGIIAAVAYYVSVHPNLVLPRWRKKRTVQGIRVHTASLE